MAAPMKQPITGSLMVRGKGVGFVTVPPFTEDIRIERDDLKDALDGDIVEVELYPPRAGDRRTGRVVNVLERATTEIIGTIKERDGVRYLAPDNRRIHVEPVLPGTGASDVGMKAAVRITVWRDTNPPEAEVTDIIGRAGDHETEMQAIIRSGGFTKTFPEAVQTAAHDLYEQRADIFKAAEADPKRRDFRNVTTFTIDPVDAKDFDDALSIQRLPSGNFEIGIHIADVSHYVRRNDVIDEEAKERGTSVYLVDRVIPMLPEVLSNDLCSLRPHEDRLAFSAVFEMTETGAVQNEWYGQTLINSDHRFSYEDAQAVLDTGAGDFHAELTTLMTIGRKLREKRYKNGAIAFEQPEIKFELDETGAPVRAYKKHRTETMLMIEDFMLLANERVAEYIYALSRKNGNELAFIYRIHDVPNPEKIEELAIFLRALGHEFKTEQGLVEAAEINSLLKSIEGTPEENLIKTATIRSMAKAVYSTKNIGHFGLAFKFYTHFTSPIRRYPDLLAHRLLRHHLDGTAISASERATFEALSIQSSKREIEAVSAERDSIKFKQVEYMERNVGKEFAGLITGVADWGIYVQEQDTLAEGMVRLSSIPGDYFEHEASKYRIKGQKTGKVYRLGDEVRVKLVKANTEERQLDFALLA